jgi:hypothetical protein
MVQDVQQGVENAVMDALTKIAQAITAVSLVVLIHRKVVVLGVSGPDTSARRAPKWSWRTCKAYGTQVWDVDHHRFISRVDG